MEWLIRFFSFKWLKSAPMKTTDGATDPVPTREPPIINGSVSEYKPFRYKTNDEGIKLIARFEGYEDEAYQCVAGVWTIGYGTTIYPSGETVKMGDTCTEPDAREWLSLDLEGREKKINKFLKKINLELNENEFSAIVSFAYNLGLGWITGHKEGSVYNALVAHDKPSVGKAFLKFNRAGGRVLRGLTRRRKAERELFTRAV